MDRRIRQKEMTPRVIAIVALLAIIQISEGDVVNNYEDQADVLVSETQPDSEGRSTNHVGILKGAAKAGVIFQENDQKDNSRALEWKQDKRVNDESEEESDQENVEAAEDEKINRGLSKTMLQLEKLKLAKEKLNHGNGDTQNAKAKLRKPIMVEDASKQKNEKPDVKANDKPKKSMPSGGINAGLLLAAEVHHAVEASKKQASHLATFLGVTKPEMELMVWKAGKSRKQEIIQATLLTSQHAAQRQASEQVNEYGIRIKGAKRQAKLLTDKAREEAEQEKMLMRQVTTMATTKDPKIVTSAFKMWQKLKAEATKSMLAAQQANQKATAETIKYTQATAHKQHVENLIARAAAHVEKEKAQLLAEYAMRKKKLAPKIKAAQEFQRLKEEQGAELIVHKWEEKVVSAKQQVVHAKQQLAGAESTIAKVQTRQNTAQAEAKQSSLNIATLKGKLDSMDTMPSAGLSNAQRHAQGTILQKSASDLTAAARTHKRNIAAVLAVTRKMQKAKSRLEYASKKHGLLRRELEKVQNILVQKKLLLKDRSAVITEEIEVPAAKPPSRPYLVPERDHIMKLKVSAVSKADAALHAAVGASSHSSASTHSQAKNSKVVQYAQHEIHEAAARNREIHALLTQLAEAAENPQPGDRHVQVPAGKSKEVPMSSLIEEEVSTSTSKETELQRTLNLKLQADQNAESDAKEGMHERLVRVKDTRVEQLKAGDTAASKMIQAAQAQYKAQGRAKKAADALAAAKKTKDPKMKNKVMALGIALQNEAQSFQDEAKVALNEEKDSVAESKAQVKAHERAKLDAATAANVAQKEAEKAKAVDVKLLAVSKSVAASQQQEAVEAARKFEAEKKVLTVLKMKKKLVHAATAKHIASIHSILSKANNASRKVVMNARRKRDAKLAAIKAKLKQRLKVIRTTKY